MTAILITALFGAIIIATFLVLADSWMRARSAFESIQRQRKLLNAGFVPTVQPAEMRLRQPARVVAITSRPVARSAAYRARVSA